MSNRLSDLTRKQKGLITLTTDFGLQDSYVAQMKGIISGINPEARMIDVSHSIPPQSLLQAACLLPDLLSSFPQGSIHLVVVDPGVGSSRRLLAAEIKGQGFVLPDNGLLDLVLKETKSEEAQIVEISNSSFWRKTVSNTFHGRDIMSPVAAHWSLGVKLEEFGQPLTSPPETLNMPEPEITKNELQGRVIYIDHFGNVITNLRKHHLEKWTKDNNLQEQNLFLEFGSHRFKGIHQSYSDSPLHEPVLLWGSSGYLELAINGGHAAEHYQLTLLQKLVINTNW